MMLAEPPSTQYDLHFNVFGFHVRVHPFFWLVALLLGMPRSSEGATTQADGMALLIWICVLFVSILVHELGHSLTMRRFGISSHIVLYMMGGLAVSDGNGFGRASRGPKESILISAAGPAAGFLLAAVIAVLIVASGGSFALANRFPFYEFELNIPDGISPLPLYILVSNLLWINIFWGLINLLPVFPLDGGQIAREVFSLWYPDGMLRSLWLSVFAGGAMAVAGLMLLQSLYVTILFGMLAVQSYFAIQQFGGGGFGGGFGRGGRPW